jgi:hypothetical protein
MSGAYNEKSIRKTNVNKREPPQTLTQLNFIHTTMIFKILYQQLFLKEFLGGHPLIGSNFQKINT